MEIKSKSTFNIRQAVTTIEINGVVYNAEPASDTCWHQTRNGDYTDGFKQGIMKAQLDLVHSGYTNKASENPLVKEHAGRIVKIASENWVTGNTALYGGNSGSEWVFAQDFPEVQEDRIVMNQDTLISRLEAEGKKIINDNLHINTRTGVRAMKRAGFRDGDYTREQTLTSNQPIWVTGDEQAPIKMADIMGIAQKLGYLSIPSQRKISVPSLREFGIWLGLGDDRWGEFVGRYSFGVRQ